MSLWKYKIGEISFEGNFINDFLNKLFSNKIEYTYYFLFAIIGVYLTMPLLSLMTKREHRKTLWYAVGVFFITNSALPCVNKVFGIEYNNDLSIQIGKNISFVILGFLLSTEDIEKRKRIFIYCLGICSIIFRYTVTLIMSTRQNELYGIFFGYEQFHSILLATAVFVLVKNINLEKIINSDKIKKIIMKISECSFGVYLIHLIVMHYELELANINVYSWKWRTIGIIITYFISLCIVYLLKKIPIVKSIVP